MNNDSINKVSEPLESQLPNPEENNFIKRFRNLLKRPYIYWSIVLAIIIVFSVWILSSPSRDVVSPGGEGWITHNGRYFVFEDGKSFFPLGMSMSGDHINYDYFGDVVFGGREFHYQDNLFGELFKEMRKNGENYLRIDIEGLGLFPVSDTIRLVDEGKIQFLEDPPGTFNEEYAKRIDRLISLAEQHDIYVNLVLIAHTCEITVQPGGEERFELYPYHSTQGGPISSIDELLRDPTAKSLWKKRLEYISDRWGGSSHIFMWELYNELLNCGGTDTVAAGQWVEEMGTHLRNYEMQKYGKAHLISVSTEEFIPNEDYFYESPGTDVFVNHLYTPILTEARQNPVLIALSINQELPKLLNQISYAEPHLENEHTFPNFFAPQDIMKEMERYGAWSYLVSGSAGTGAAWVWLGEGGNVSRKGDIVHSSHKAIAKVIKDFDFSTFDSRPVNPISSNPEIHPMAVTDGKRAIGWILHNNPDDYAIEYINRLRNGEITDPHTTLFLFGEWIRFYQEKGVEISFILDPQLDMLAEKIAERLNLSSQQAREIIDMFFEDPRSVRGLIVLNPGIIESLKENADVILKNLRDGLEKVERETEMLEKTYRGHPEMRTEFSFKLNPGSYTVQWYDTSTGNKISEETIESDGLIKLVTPVFRRNIAFVIK